MIQSTWPRTAPRIAPAIFFALMVSATDAQCTDTCHYASDGLRDDGRPDAVFEFKIDAEDVSSIERVTPGSICMTTLTCFFAFDSDCDDGSPGSELPVCAFGAECVDCGVRTASPPPPPHSPATICMNKCLNAGGSECSDDGGGPGSEYPDYQYGTDCTECSGVRPIRPPPTSSPPMSPPAPSPPPGICMATCSFASDSGSNDGSPGSELPVCAFGAECVDCGVRTASPPPPPHSPATICMNKCLNAGGSECSDDGGGPGSEYPDYQYGTDCANCSGGVRPIRPPPTSSPPMSPPATSPPPGICMATCFFASDSGSNDGSPGSELPMCAFGAECVDCGVRTASPPPPPHSPATICMNECLNAGGSECSDDGGGPGSEFATCAYATDCVGCGPRVSMPSAPPRSAAAHPAPNPPPSMCSNPCSYTSDWMTADDGLCKGARQVFMIALKLLGASVNHWFPYEDTAGDPVEEAAKRVSSALLKCWGHNYYGSLGDNTTTGRLAPTTIDVGGAVGLLALGRAHTCAYVTASALLKCWGSNENGYGSGYGQLGDGTTTNRNTPTTIDVGGAVGLLALGDYHTCAYVTADAGTLKCWGLNIYGQLGDGTNTNRNTPTTINVGGAVGLLALGYATTCAYLTASELLKCWGSNSDGQLGNGNTFTSYNPITINVGGAVGLLALGSSHTCAYVTASALLKCWGSNYQGQLGDNTTTSRATPTTIDVGGAVGLLALEGSTCAYVTDGAGTLKCWGNNGDGQLGD
ncbi:regulator of chromosome condensation rcc1, partial [Chrysochromulina tobinii]